jgi:hypothetical protein
MASTGVVKNAIVTFDGDAFAAQLKMAKLIPEASTQSYPVLVPAGNKTDVSSPVWKFSIEGLQDHTTATGLAAYLTANHGTVVECTLAPFTGTGEKLATFDVVLVAVDFGGTTGEFADFSVELGVVGQPVFTTQA